MFESFEELEDAINNCEKCGLCKNRKNVVIGYGNKNADIMIVGEGPSSEDDIQGIPFVGLSGKLMDQAFEGVGINKENIYITNVSKCKAFQGKELSEEETKACLDYLRNQVNLVKPKIVVLLGKVALTNIIGKEYSITNERGKIIELGGMFFIPTYHPAALLRDESKKIDFWNDLKLVVEKAKELNILF